MRILLVFSTYVNCMGKPTYIFIRNHTSRQAETTLTCTPCQLLSGSRGGTSVVVLVCFLPGLSATPTLPRNLLCFIY